MDLGFTVGLFRVMVMIMIKMVRTRVMIMVRFNVRVIIMIMIMIMVMVMVRVRGPGVVKAHTESRVSEHMRGQVTAIQVHGRKLEDTVEFELHDR